MHRSCSCGQHYSNSFSMIFTMPYDQHICPYASKAPVDCTLSLATPSTRLAPDEYYDSSGARFCWDFLQPDKYPSRPPPPHKSTRGGVDNASAGDSLVARRCANCDTTSTPLWRNGPRGPKSLCNACGIRYKKEERRANEATAATSGGVEVAATHKLPSCYSPAAVGGEFRFTDDVDDRDSTFMSWRLNVTDRAGLVHDFTRY